MVFCRFLPILHLYSTLGFYIIFDLYISRLLHLQIYMAETNKQINKLNYNTQIVQYLDIQTMKFRQLIEYNMRNIFLEKSYSKFGEEASPICFYKKSELSIYL